MTNWWGHAAEQCAQAIITDTLFRKETDQYGKQRVRVGQEKIFVISKERCPQGAHGTDPDAHVFEPRNGGNGHWLLVLNAVLLAPATQPTMPNPRLLPRLLSPCVQRRSVSRWTLQIHLSFMMPAVQEDAKSTEQGHMEQAHVVILTSPKPVAIDEDHDSSRFRMEELVAATSHTHRWFSLILRSP